MSAAKPSPQTGYRPFMLRGGRLTKINGILASVAPQVGEAMNTLKPIAVAVGIVVGGLMLPVGSALAVAGQCGTEQAGQDTLTCNATSYPLGIYYANTDGLTLNLPNSETVVGSAGGSASNGVHVGAISNDIKITQGKGTITGSSRGINTYNSGTGNIIIDTAGTVTGNNREGINAENTTDGASITITQTDGTIEGGFNGIRVDNYGTGSTTVDTSGTVTGKSRDGIYALMQYDGTDLTITQKAGTIEGGNRGINAINYGKGSTTVDTAGTVTGKNGEGINASNTSDGASITITQTAGVNADDGIYAWSGVTTTNMTITQTDGTIKGVTNGINAINNGTGSTTVDTSGTVTGDAGDGIYAWNNSGTDLTITQKAGEITGATKGINVTNKGTGPLTITTSGAVTGTADSGIWFDGNTSATTVNVKSGSVVKGGIAGITGKSTGGAITINNSGTIQNLSGLSTDQAIHIPTDPTINNDAGGLVTGTVNTVAPTIFNNANGATWNTAGGTNDFDLGSTGATGNSINNSGLILASLTGATAAVTTTFNKVGTFNNNAGGELRMKNGITGDISKVNGNYVGADGIISIDAALGEDSSATDQLHITGNASGTSVLKVNNVGGLGAQTVVGIDVITVDGTAAADSFAMANPVQAGAYEYTLKQGGNGGNTKNWYLVSSFRSAIAGYIAAQAANRDAAMNQIGTLHQRMGEQRHADGADKQLWMRLIADGDRASGHNRFDYQQANYGIQVGADLIDRTNASGKNERAGLTLNYARSDTDFADTTRSLSNLSTDTGGMTGHNYGLGAYYTSLAKDGTYLDLVANIARLRNRFEDTYSGKATQTGWQTNLSAEVGKPIYQAQSGWQLEPQAQLIWQRAQYGGFKDNIASIDGYSHDNVRGRVGVRLFNNTKTTGKHNSYYMIANVLHDFTGLARIGTSNTTVNEQYDRTRGEIGIGAQTKLSKNSFFYADARYRKSFGGNSEGGQVSAGLNIDW